MMLIRVRDEIPSIGTRFVAFYDDHSGAAIMLRHDDGYIETEGGERDNLDNFDSWYPLPDGFSLWFEDHAPDPPEDKP